ncbi:hypothetical protein XENOCAPTIV_011826, partial [Xenoophorus captivus]
NQISCRDEDKQQEMLYLVCRTVSGSGGPGLCALQYSVGPLSFAAGCVLPTSHRERGISVTAQTGQLTSLYEWMWACWTVSGLLNNTSRV